MPWAEKLLKMSYSSNPLNLWLATAMFLDQFIICLCVSVQGTQEVMKDLA